MLSLCTRKTGLRLISLETAYLVWDDLQKQKTNFIILGSIASGSNISPSSGHRSFRICQLFTFDHLSFCFFETFTRITPDLEKHQTDGGLNFGFEHWNIG